MAIERGNLAQTLPSDVFPQESIGQVIRLPRRSFWSTEIHISTILKMVLPVAALMLSAIFIPLFFGWVPVIGRSMQPTLPCFGGFVKIAKTKHYKPGDIVCLNGQTLGHSVKRIAKITSQGLFVRGDNTDQSMDSSYGMDARNPFKEVIIPLSEVKGKVIHIWSFSRAFRSRTREGRFQNWVEFRFSPYQRLESGSWVLVEKGGLVIVFSADTQPKHFQGELCSNFRKGRFSIWQSDSRVDVNLETGTQARIAFAQPQLPARLEAIVKIEDHWIKTQSLLFPYSLPDHFNIIFDDQLFYVSGIKMAFVPEFNGAPGTIVTFLGVRIPIQSGKIGVKIRPL